MSERIIYRHDCPSRRNCWVTVMLVGNRDARPKYRIWSTEIRYFGYLGREQNNQNKTEIYYGIIYVIWRRESLTAGQRKYDILVSCVILVRAEINRIRRKYYCGYFGPDRNNQHKTENILV